MGKKPIQKYARSMSLRASSAGRGEAISSNHSRRTDICSEIASSPFAFAQGSSQRQNQIDDQMNLEEHNVMRISL